MTLMQAFEERSWAAGARSMHLSVYPENKAARRLYEKAGWMPLLDTITPSDAVYYYKTIGRSE
jgi:ribosomal protein S18 acetylase RimI-like enzyme